MNPWWWPFYSWGGFRTKRFYCWGFAGTALVIMVSVKQDTSLQAPGNIAQIMVLKFINGSKIKRCQPSSNNCSFDRVSTSFCQHGWHFYITIMRKRTTATLAQRYYWLGLVLNSLIMINIHYFYSELHHSNKVWLFNTNYASICCFYFGYRLFGNQKINWHEFQ